MNLKNLGNQAGEWQIRDQGKLQYEWELEVDGQRSQARPGLQRGY